MLSRLLQSVHNIIPYQISNLEVNSGTENQTSIPEMVVAASHDEQTATILPDQPIHKELVDSDVSSGSSERRLPPEPTPDGNEGRDGYDEEELRTLAPSAKRQKNLPTRNKDGDDTRVLSHLEVFIPVKDIVEGTVNRATVKKTEKGKDENVSPDDNISLEISQPEDEKPPAEDEGLSKTTLKTTEEESFPHETPDKQIKVERKRIPKSKGSPATAPASSVKPKHKRFGSEEPSVHELEFVPEQAQRQLQDEDENSDDDAPEVVARPDAQEKTRQSARKAARAIEDQEVMIRQKRKIQDLRLKDQAKTAGRKRKRGDPMNQIKESTRGMPISENDLKEIASLPDPLSKISKSRLPPFLPLEYLEDHNPSTNITDVVAKKGTGRGKKTKFLDSTPKKPKDLVRGSTTFRIAEAKDDGLLPPKANYVAMSTKEKWLQGRAGKVSRGVVGLMRRPVNQGFLVKKR